MEFYFGEIKMLNVFQLYNLKELHFVFKLKMCLICYSYLQMYFQDIIIFPIWYIYTKNNGVFFPFWIS